MDKYKLLNRQDWEKIILELSNYSLNLFSFWKLAYDRSIRGFSPEELAMEAIKKTLTGEWNWNPELDLMFFLKRNLKGMIYNLAVNKKENKLTVTREIGDFDSVSESYNIEDEMTSKRRLDFLFDNIKGNEVEEILFKCWCDGMKKKEICETMNISDTDYKNAYKRLKNKLLKLDIKKRLESN